MNTNRLWIIFFAALTPLWANEKPSPVKTEGGGSAFLHRVLPRSFQKNPEVNCNVITEVLPAGKKLKPPTPARPMYYVMQSGWYQSLGEITRADTHRPTVAALEGLMKNALKTNGYIESTSTQHLPTLVIVFSYGDNSADNAEIEEGYANAAALGAFEEATRERARVSPTIDANADDFRGRSAAEAAGQLPISEDDLIDVAPPPARPEADLAGLKSPVDLLPFILTDRNKIRQVIGRAALVGGGAFARQLSAVLKDEASARNAIKDSSRMSKFAIDEAQRQATTGFKSAVATWHGYDDAARMEFASPFIRFYQKDAQTQHLVEDAFSSCYFVVATAYDGAAIGQGERRVLWRTKMTVNSLGVGMSDVLPVLIASASPYFGREMAEPVTVSKRIIREGNVKLGTPTPVETLSVSPPPGTK